MLCLLVGSKGCCKVCYLLWKAMEQGALLIVQPRDPLHSGLGVHGMQPRLGGSVSSSKKPTGEVDGD